MRPQQGPHSIVVEHIGIFSDPLLVASNIRSLQVLLPKLLGNDNPVDKLTNHVDQVNRPSGHPDREPGGVHARESAGIIMCTNEQQSFETKIN